MKILFMRRIFIAALLLLANLSSLAYDFEDGGFYYNILDADAKTVEVTFPSSDTPSEKRYSGEIIIPAETSYNNEKYNVTQIGWASFRGSSITKVTIPSTIKSIKGNAFSWCQNLKEAIVEEGIKELGDSMFCHCFGNLVSVKLPSSLKVIGSSVFDTCMLLTSVVIPEGVVRIGDSAFFACNNFKEVIIPSTVREIGSECFGCCDKIEYVEIPEGVVRIEDNTFGSCEALKSVSLPQSLTYIGSFAFSGCNNLKSINIPENVKSIGSCSFLSCSLENVELHDGLEIIMYGAFACCEKLTSLKIPDSVKVIESVAFYECTALKTIEIGSGLQSIGGACFEGCDILESITVHALEPPVAREIPEETPDLNPDTATESDYDKLGTFAQSHYENVALTVPVNSIPKYKDADKTYGTPVWPNFKYFTNEILTGVDSVAAEGDGNSEVVARYDLSGRPVADDYRGLTIVRRADGTVAKEIRR